MKAAVCRQGSDLFCVEELSIDDPRRNEVLVRFTATGLCHTDLVVASGWMPTPFPVVAGHEGAGVVEAVGSAVTGFSPGDRVVASFSFCGSCRNCLSGQPAYCPDHFPLNFGAQRADGSVGLCDASGNAVRDHFFGQSSFADYGLCRPSSLIRMPATSPPDLAATVPFPGGAVGCDLEHADRARLVRGVASLNARAWEAVRNA